MSEQPAVDPTPGAWPRAAVPSVPGDAWHWQLDAMPVISRVRMDLRARIAHPSVASGSTEDARDGLLLAFEELASNGVRHSGAPVSVRVTGTASGWLVDVSDARPDSPPVPAVDRDPALGGLGLHLIARLSARHGWAVVGRRKHVWACLTLA
jgi:anti-sigma regulatory factor (Ser/Thr protein kinase)